MYIFGFALLDTFCANENGKGMHGVIPLKSLLLSNAAFMQNLWWFVLEKVIKGMKFYDRADSPDIQGG